jgi:MFS family permease
LIIFLASWNFAVNLAAPFFTVYLLKTLGYPMTTILALTIASQLSNLAALGLWGALIDRFSNKAVLGMAAPLFLGCMLAWTFTGLAWTQPIALYLLAAIHVLMGVSTSGVGLASGNIAMKLSPLGQATAYLAANSVITASCAAVAPIIGGLFADYFAGGPQDVTLQVLTFHAWTFFFAIACVLGLYSLHRLTLVDEPSGTTDPADAAPSPPRGAALRAQPLERRRIAARGAAASMVYARPRGRDRSRRARFLSAASRRSIRSVGAPVGVPVGRKGERANRSRPSAQARLGGPCLASAGGPPRDTARGQPLVANPG